MANISFYLRREAAKRKTIINLVFTYDGYRMKVSTGESIFPKYWNARSQRARELIEFPQHKKINEKLEACSQVILKIYKDHWEEGMIPEPELLRKEFLLSRNKPVKANKPATFWDHFDEFVEHKKKQFPKVKDFDTALRKHLVKTEELFGLPLSFSLLSVKTDGFIARMDEYLTNEAMNAKGEPGLSTNTIGKQFKNLKVFLNWYFDKDATARFSMKHIVVKTEEVDNIYITESELKSIESLKPEKKEEQMVRDLFIIGCETALRFGDFTRLSREHIRKHEIHFRPQKTEGHVSNNNVVIPISARLKRVFDRYDGGPPQVQNCKLTDFNRTIRTICRKAKITDDILMAKKIAGKTTEHVYKKFELVSSHTCRRTFCTLKFLAGMPAQVVMKFSGHKTESAFLRYLKLDAELAAKKYVDFFR